MDLERGRRTLIDRVHVALEHDLVPRRSPYGYARPPGLLELTERVGNLDLRLFASRAARGTRDGREIAPDPRLSRRGHAEGKHQRQQWDQASRPSISGSSLVVRTRLVGRREAVQSL